MQLQLQWYWVCVNIPAIHSEYHRKPYRQHGLLMHHYHTYAERDIFGNYYRHFLPACSLYL